MGRRGPTSKAPGGYGHVTKKGYLRVYCTQQKRQRMEHVVVWERFNGPVPDGFQVHHRDEDKLNNALDNLELVSPLAHKRMHGGCEKRDDGWWKPCRNCGTFHPIDHYYKHKDGISSWCRACCIANVTKNKRLRKARNQK